jgi:hypothetical protein
VNECVLVNVDEGNNERVCDDVLGYGKNHNTKHYIQHPANVPGPYPDPSQPYIPNGPSSTPLVSGVYSGSSRYLGVFIFTSGLNSSLSLESAGDLGAQGCGATAGGSAALRGITSSYLLTGAIGLRSSTLGS